MMTYHELVIEWTWTNDNKIESKENALRHGDYYNSFTDVPSINQSVPLNLSYHIKMFIYRIDSKGSGRVRRTWQNKVFANYLNDVRSVPPA